ncbi:class I SAM-dependent methyltransferase [Oceanospirillum sediminis]|uniref:Class I SAM-dependent methyltransferase n=1 Tax=Oceanospirillum sediminis TaxID=2760088 RepID=A0A839IUJ4_9GAMM|nr:class I SAM-dependent methyltransferase [Oceanospirillum sediminis]MBB1489025.1 class I SAM-dependent methyltransferase [Oceanospirillum sediminis]
MDISAITVFEQQLIEFLDTPSSEARRIFHGRGCFWPGLEHITADWLQGHLLVSLFREPDAEFLQALKQVLLNISKHPTLQDKPDHSVLLHYRHRNGCPVEVITGQHSEYTDIQEHGLSYRLDLTNKQNNGLFLDMRNGRQWVQENSADKKVLNLFAYTCGFSVAALAGNAQSVVNLDMSSPALSRGRENHRLNDHDLSKVRFLAHDLFKTWGKIRKTGPYDLIIIDPPSFQKGSFILTKDYPRVLRQLNSLLSDNGTVMACANDPEIHSSYLINLMKQEAPELRFFERLANPEEFPDKDEEKSLKVMLFQR